MKYKRFTAAVVSAVLLGTLLGCSNKPKVDEGTQDAFVQSRVNLMKQLADEVAKNPGGVQVAGIVEELSNGAIDPQAYPNEVAEILKIYNERVKPKIRGEAAGQLQVAMARLQPPKSAAK